MNFTDTAATFATWWLNTYTRGVSFQVASGRRDEIASDLYEQRAEAASRGERRSVTATSIVARTIGGVAADLSWRTRQREGARRRTTTVTAGAVPVDSGEHGWLHHRIHHRRCSACGERYPRRLPNCPRCKTVPGGSGDGGGEGRHTAWPLGFG
jgi:NADH:ubiquinone oxidoreductase subunit